MAGLVEHLYDPYSTLCEVRRVLRPGGVLWFNAPNEDGLYTQIGNLYMRSLRRDWVVNLAPTFSPFHVQGFNPRSLRTLLKRVNFTVERFKVHGEMYPLTGKPSVRKRLEYCAAILVNWVGNRCGSGIYIDIWAKKSE
jgi:SAM-dependent methyltransferase